MKKLNAILIAVLTVLAMACKQKPVDYAIITGEVQNYSAGDVKVVSDDRSEIVLKIDSTGSINDTLRLAEGQYYLVMDESYLGFYVFHGGTLHFTADANDFLNTIRFTGHLPGMSNYLLAKTKLNDAERKEGKKLFSLDEDAFLEKTKSKMAALKAELEKVTDISDSLRSLEDRAIKMGYLHALNFYPEYYSYFNKIEDYEPSERFKSEASGFDYNDTNLFKYSREYRSLLVGDLRLKSKDLVKTGEASSEGVAALTIAKDIENELIREELLFISIKRGFSRLENKDEIYSSYMEIAKDEGHRKEISEVYNQISMLDKGKPSPKFYDYENYAGGTTSLDDFKGKYVYIDVWATWCGPCKAEIPHLKKIEEKYHGRNIAFVSISIDEESAKQTWRNMIAEKEMGGVQLFATDKKFKDGYVISGIPRFILIDPEGNIVEKNAPRPSDERLVKLFEQLKI